MPKPIAHVPLDRRAQILAAAARHFRVYGYAKTTVADVAQAVGVSAPYIYKFFDSKQAIGEAVCCLTFRDVGAALARVATEARPAGQRLRRLFKTMLDETLELMDREPKLVELVSAALDEGWSSVAVYRDGVLAAIRRVVDDGRAAGELERDTPVDEACAAVFETLRPFGHPVLLKDGNRAELERHAAQVGRLVARGLAASG